MIVTTPFGPGGQENSGPAPSPGRALPTVDELAAQSLTACLREQPYMATQIQETARAQTHLGLEQQREDDAAWAAAGARQLASSLAARLDTAGQRCVGTGAGTVVVASLLLLDIVPLNWAAQAFNLASGGTWLITLILVAASGGAMAGLEAARDDARRRGLLLGLMALAFAALTVLRTFYLVTVTETPIGAAGLQAVLLSAVSAGLVVCGSIVLSRTRPLVLSRALAAARRADRVQARCVAARRRAEETLERHWAVLVRLLRDWSYAGTAPSGVSQAGWTSALERCLAAIFPVS